jgi:hypothetical protein
VSLNARLCKVLLDHIRVSTNRFHSRLMPVYKVIMGVLRFKNIAGTETDFVLEVETQEFEKRQADLQRKYPGKVVIFQDTRLVGAFDSMDEAIREAISRFGDTPCLIRRVDAPRLSRASLTLRF